MLYGADLSLNSSASASKIENILHGETTQCVIALVPRALCYVRTHDVIMYQKGAEDKSQLCSPYITNLYPGHSHRIASRYSCRSFFTHTLSQIPHVMKFPFSSLAVLALSSQHVATFPAMLSEVMIQIRSTNEKQARSSSIEGGCPINQRQAKASPHRPGA